MSVRRVRDGAGITTMRNLAAEAEPQCQALCFLSHFLQVLLGSVGKSLNFSETHSHLNNRVMKVPISTGPGGIK